ncbi:hypothetical protein DVA67_030420 [Solirubrobacter sp. CPCC 204708]|uniref:Class I SAM-dependent methyltransferase n=1 Tax=Solirubrobacter deserti TaxID=2282478 RepID=A0ABT4RIC2_9ACTN|nr:hypothetical protein [Solirubrobacter deserti]MBE2320320.1 hypothetical protein [Solirubrobacter deserti]MDA0138294.1 class I SAM-dependent methyltransferase [Solirubrobacter deserti]
MSAHADPNPALTVGVDAAGLRFLLTATGVDLARTLTIGRQQLFLEQDALEAAFRDHGRPLAAHDARELLAGDRWAEPLFERLGAGSVSSLDASDYEGATIVADLNRPVDTLDAQFSCVFDGGTLEHVFEFPTALRSCMRMVAQGGHLITISPFDHYAGHGFYQLGPEVPFRAFTRENGYELERVLVSEGAERWWELSDPLEVGRRPVLPRRRPMLIYAQARRVDLTEPLRIPPQESDYAALWAGRSVSPAPRPSLVDRMLGRAPRDPAFMRRVRL